MAQVGFEGLRGHRYMNLTTFRKNGEPVRTTVWFAESGGKLYVYTGRNTGKAKRIRQDGSVLVGPCNPLGKPLGPETAAVARFLSPQESTTARELHDAKYGLQKRAAAMMIENVLGFSDEVVYLEISPAPQGHPAWEKLQEVGRNLTPEATSGAVFTRQERYRWWHALIFGIVVNLVARVLSRPQHEQEQYEKLRQAPFAPPAWVFGPVWTVNNASQLWGNLRLLNLPEDTPDRGKLLWLQGATWVLYSTFTWAYFRKRSPILALAWTAAFYILTIASAALSWRADRKMIFSFVTLLLWLSLATPVAAYQAIHNPDPVFRTPALRK